ncbi:MAG: molecular chaperone DnaJ [Candidatus Uhrbacteria bacterium]|nr:molecular chaperone DnaJ [Candidatus Uhrbacteria bacterium]
MSKDYYKILGVPKSASEDEIKKAFRRLAHEHHPDKGGDQAKFKDLNEAYQILSDKQKRGTYDRFGSAAFDGSTGSPFNGQQGGFGGFQGQGFPGGFEFNFGGGNGQDFGDLGDVLGEMFGFRGAQGSRSKQAHGKDIEMDLELSFREAAFGVADRSMKLYKYHPCSRCKGDGAEPGTKIKNCETCGGQGQVRQAQRTVFGNVQTVVTCPTCHGRGKKPEKDCSLCRGQGVERREQVLHVQIPAGIQSDEVMKVSGEGEAAPYGGRAGDLYLRIHVKTDPHFEREGNDVRSIISIPYSVLVLGGSIEVETLDGKTSLKIPEATNPGTNFQLRGKGVPYLRSHGRGDHIVTVTTETPKKLTKEQKKLLEELKERGL